jgi:hypothetical protein
MSIFLIILFFSPLQKLGAPYIESTLILNIGAAFCSYAVATLLTLVAQRFVTYPEVNAIDRLLGVGLGVIRGLLICTTVFLLCIIVTTESYLNARNALEVAEAVVAAPYPKWAGESICANLCFSFLTSIFEAVNQQWLCGQLSKIVF